MDTQISIRLDNALVRGLDRRARALRTTRSDLIRSILRSATEGRVAETTTAYGRTRDLVGSLRGPDGAGAVGRAQLIDMLKDRRG